MLNKLEALYLNILRVVIIVLATVLLAVAAIGAVVAAPMLLSSFGGGEADAARWRIEPATPTGDSRRRPPTSLAT